MKQYRFDYGQDHYQIVEAPNDLPVEKIMLEEVETVVALGCKVTLVNRKTQQVVQEWKPNGSVILNVDHITPENTPMLSVRKKPIVVHALRMDRPFETTTLEGRINGKAGDYLMIGINGERYPIDGEIFEKTYDVLDSMPTVINNEVIYPDERLGLNLLDDDVPQSFREAVKAALEQPIIKIKRPGEK